MTLDADTAAGSSGHGASALRWPPGLGVSPRSATGLGGSSCPSGRPDTTPNPVSYVAPTPTRKNRARTSSNRFKRGSQAAPTGGFSAMIPRVHDATRARPTNARGFGVGLDVLRRPVAKAGGFAARSRWLSGAIPPALRAENSRTPDGVPAVQPHALHPHQPGVSPGLCHQTSRTPHCARLAAPAPRIPRRGRAWTHDPGAARSAPRTHRREPAIPAQLFLRVGPFLSYPAR